MKSSESIGSGPSELTTNVFYRDIPENRLVHTTSGNIHVLDNSYKFEQEFSEWSRAIKLSSHAKPSWGGRFSF